MTEQSDYPPTRAADDLYSKLDSLINKHEEALASYASAPSIPVLTEAVALQQPMPDIPVLDDPVDFSTERAAIEEKRRQLQVALYLRLRQCLDAQLDQALGTHSAFVAAQAQPQLARVTQDLRAALPQIVRDSVAQVFGPDGAMG